MVQQCISKRGTTCLFMKRERERESARERPRAWTEQQQVQTRTQFQAVSRKLEKGHDENTESSVVQICARSGVGLKCSCAQWCPEAAAGTSTSPAKAVTRDHCVSTQGKSATYLSYHPQKLMTSGFAKNDALQRLAVTSSRTEKSVGSGARIWDSQSVGPRETRIGKAAHTER